MDNSHKNEIKNFVESKNWCSNLDGLYKQKCESILQKLNDYQYSKPNRIKYYNNLKNQLYFMEHYGGKLVCEPIDGSTVKISKGDDIPLDKFQDAYHFSCGGIPHLFSRNEYSIELDGIGIWDINLQPPMHQQIGLYRITIKVDKI